MLSLSTAMFAICYEDTTTVIPLRIVPNIVQCMNNSVIQNETISKEKHYAAETMKIGTNVVDYIEHGNVLIDGGKVSIRSKTVEILPNTTIINSEFNVIPTN